MLSSVRRCAGAAQHASKTVKHSAVWWKTGLGFVRMQATSGHCRSSTTAWANAAAAFRQLSAARYIGKIVVEVPQQVTTAHGLQVLCLEILSLAGMHVG